MLWFFTHHVRSTNICNLHFFFHSSFIALPKPSKWDSSPSSSASLDSSITGLGDCLGSTFWTPFYLLLICQFDSSSFFCLPQRVSSILPMLFMVFLLVSAPVVLLRILNTPTYMMRLPKLKMLKITFIIHVYFLWLCAL